MDGLTDDDVLNYAHTVKDKDMENERVMMQLAKNPDNQVLLGDLPKAVMDAIIYSSEVHQRMKMQLLSDTEKAGDFVKVILGLLRDAG